MATQDHDAKSAPTLSEPSPALSLNVAVNNGPVAPAVAGDADSISAGED